jgi:hypothetical protein
MQLPHIDPRYLDPRNWPAIVYIWIAFVLIGSVPQLYKYFVRQRALSSWIPATARVELASYARPSGLRQFFSNRKNRLIAEIAYSYEVEGVRHAGTYTREFQIEAEAADFIRDLRGRSVVIRFNPRNSSRSTLPDSDLDTLLASRPASPEHQDAINAAHEPPAIIRPFLWPLTFLATAGLVLSAAVHLATWFGIRLLGQAWFFALHIGIFIVFFPAVFLLEKSGSNSPKKMFIGTPTWMKYMVEALGVYAMVNFAVFMIMVWGEPKNTPIGPLHWRGFSGHWMVFYSAALAVLYPAAIYKRETHFQRF